MSNFNQPHLEKLLATANVTPAINQVELHPQLAQNSLRHFNSLHGIKTEAWAPLGRARFNDNILLGEIAESLGKTVAQVIIRWHLQLGNLVIPKSSNPDRLAENFDVFDFELSEHNMGVIATLTTNPDDMN